VASAKVLVLRGGGGVAGDLDARRLGAMVEAYDVRSAAAEEVHIVGARFVELDLGRWTGREAMPGR